MNTRLRAFLAAASVVVVASTTIASQANAFGLRVPQVNVLGGALQGYLTGQGQGINVLTDQQDAQVWSQSASGNGVLTIMVEFSGNAPVNSLGIYNASDAAPALFQVFPGAATNGWFAIMAFRTGPTRVIVSLFDATSAFQGSATYFNVTADDFGFYLQQPGGQVLYSQDYRNPGGNAQMLAYQGDGIATGEWWLCWEDTAINGAGLAAARVAGSASDQDFDDAVLVLESINPLATLPTTLGAVKALYRK